jgi:hypothetical protein
MSARYHFTGNLEDLTKIVLPKAGPRVLDSRTVNLDIPNTPKGPIHFHYTYEVNLLCAGVDCSAMISSEVCENVKAGEAWAILRAIAAGWKYFDGYIFCPTCAEKRIK